MHARLTGVHVRSHIHARQPRVRQWSSVHRGDNHANHLAARLQCAVRDCAHQAGFAAAVDDADAASGEGDAH